MPKAPVPSQESVLRRYVEYASVVGSGPQTAATEAMVKDFVAGPGPGLHKQLEAIAEAEENWINRFWLPEMYLKNRACLPAYSNPAYVFPHQTFANSEQFIRYGP